MRKFLGGLIIVLMIVLLSPWLTGMWFEHTYQKLIRFYNLQGDFNIDLLRYQRGWWTSEATLQIEVINPQVLKYVENSGISKPKLKIIFDQYIHHGPIIIYTDASSLFGLAFIHNKVKLSDDIQAIVKSKIHHPVSISVNDFIEFNGDYHKYFSISPFQFADTENKFLIQVNEGLRGSVWFSPEKNQVKGNILFSNIILNHNRDLITIPRLEFQFNQYRIASGLWLGESNASISDLNWESENENYIHLTDINIRGAVNGKSGELYGERSINIKKIEFADHTLGPVRFQMSASGLSEKGLLNLITTYQRIMRRGELYESQLSQNMSNLIPSLFTQKTEIKIDGLNVDSPEGNLLITGSMNWPYNESSASGIMDLYQDAMAQGSLRISQRFLNKIIDDISVLPYFRSISRERRDQLVDLQINLQAANQRNFLFISRLVDEGSISEDDAIQLLTLQKNDESLDAYFDMIKELYLKRQISRPLSYMLFWQYVDVKRNVTLLDQAFDADQKVVRQQMYDQIKQWIKDGYIKQENNDYVISVQKDTVSMKVNGKEI